MKSCSLFLKPEYMLEVPAHFQQKSSFRGSKSYSLWIWKQIPVSVFLGKSFYHSPSSNLPTRTSLYRTAYIYLKNIWTFHTCKSITRMLGFIAFLFNMYGSIFKSLFHRKSTSIINDWVIKTVSLGRTQVFIEDDMLPLSL